MGEASVLVSCPGCGVRGRARPHLVGRTIRCPRCFGDVKVPAAETRTDDPAGTPATHSDSAAGEALRLRLHALRRRLQGPEHELGPVRGDAALRVLERMEGLRIPSEYRGFLRIVGDGGAFGPRHGLHRPGGWGALPGESDAERVARRQATFTFNGARRWDAESAEVQARYRRAAAKGVLELGSEGCGVEWILILTGPFRGQVWLRTAIGVTPPPGRPTFLPWLERLLGRDRQWWKAPLDAWDFWTSHPVKQADLAMCQTRPQGAKLEPISAAAPLCVDCAAWLAARSRQDGRVRCVSDPLAVTVFEPDGPPVAIPHAAECA